MENKNLQQIAKKFLQLQIKAQSLPKPAQAPQETIKDNELAETINEMVRLAQGLTFEQLAQVDSILHQMVKSIDWNVNGNVKKDQNI